MVILHLITIRLYAEGVNLCLRVLRGDFFCSLQARFVAVEGVMAEIYKNILSFRENIWKLGI